MWLASFKQPSAVHGKAGKSATSVGLRAPAGRFDAAKGESIDTGDLGDDFGDRAESIPNSKILLCWTGLQNGYWG